MAVAGALILTLGFMFLMKSFKLIERSTHVTRIANALEVDPSVLGFDADSGVPR